MFTAITATEATWLAGGIGLLIGSFLAMLTWRLPRIMDQDGHTQLRQLTFSRSHCPHCHATLTWYQLIPIISWLLQKAQCPHCHSAISLRYPLIEVTSALLSAAAIYQLGLNETGIAGLVFTWILLAIAVIDIEHQLILDSLSLPLLWIGLMINTHSIFNSPEQAIWGAVLGYGLLWLVFQLYQWITHKEGMGYGDFKLLAAIGAWFGAYAIPQVLLIASASSLIIALILVLTKRHQFSTPMPFGPYLAIAAWVQLMFGQILI